jgi:BatD DUF11 like domain
VSARLACLLALLLAPVIALARLDASVDETTVSAADTIRLTLRADGANLTGDPDFDALSSQFDVLNSQRSSQFRSINGRTDAWTTWTLLLKPKHTGTLEIPALSLGSDTSKPITITVRDLDPQLKRAIAQTVFFETSYAPTEVYVQSQVVVTRRLFYVNGAQLYGDMPDLPEVPGAMVKSLGEAEHSTVVRDGRQYGMIEQRFALFPERSGELTVPAATVTGSVRLASDSAMYGRRIGVDVSSDTLTIPVLPIPADYPADAAWLPATDVELLEDWPGQPQRGLVTGTPSQRTLIVRADGNTASAIPPLPAALPDSLKAYPEPPKLSETQARTGIIGTRTESSSLVATQPGQLALPEARVTWFDTVHHQIKFASLPARTITVTGTATAAPPPKAAATQAETPAAETPAAASAGTTHAAPVSNPWWTLGLGGGVIAALAACGLAAWLWRRRRAPRQVVADPRRREADAYRAFCRACDGREPRGIRAALDTWLTSRYPGPLMQATRRFAADPAAHDALNALNARLYQPDAGTFDPMTLRRCVDAARATAAKVHHSDELPALYPST